MKEFIVPKKERVKTIITGIFLVLAGIAMIIIPFHTPIGPESLFGVIGLGFILCGYSLYVLYETRFLNYKVTADNNSISKFYPYKPDEILTWDQITGVKYREKLEKLVLYAENGEMVLDFQLESFPFLELHLAKMVEKIRPDILEHYEKQYGETLKIDDLIKEDWLAE